MPQGSILGPLIFKLHVSNNIPPSISMSIFFADDTISYAPGFTHPRLLFSPASYHFLIIDFFRLKIRPSTVCRFLYIHPCFWLSCKTVNGIHISLAKSYTYLKIWFDRRLSFMIHIHLLTKKSSYLSIKLCYLIFQTTSLLL